LTLFIQKEHVGVKVFSLLYVKAVSVSQLRQLAAAINSLQDANSNNRTGIPLLVQ
jgi:hypothetical protein